MAKKSRITWQERKDRDFKREIEKSNVLEKFVFPQETDLPRIDWEELIKSKRKYRSEPSGSEEYAQPYADIIRYLRLIHVLAPSETPGSLSVIGNGIDLSPNVGFGILHFIREEDAIQYAQAEFRNAKYPVTISKTIIRIN